MLIIILCVSLTLFGVINFGLIYHILKKKKYEYHLGQQIIDINKKIRSLECEIIFLKNNNINSQKYINDKINLINHNINIMKLDVLNINLSMNKIIKNIDNINNIF